MKQFNLAISLPKNLIGGGTRFEFPFCRKVLFAILAIPCLITLISKPRRTYFSWMKLSPGWNVGRNALLWVTSAQWCKKSYYTCHLSSLTVRFSSKKTDPLEIQHPFSARQHLGKRQSENPVWRQKTFLIRTESRFLRLFFGLARNYRRSNIWESFVFFFFFLGLGSIFVFISGFASEKKKKTEEVFKKLAAAATRRQKSNSRKN